MSYKSISIDSFKGISLSRFVNMATLYTVADVLRKMLQFCSWMWWILRC